MHHKCHDSNRPSDDAFFLKARDRGDYHRLKCTELLLF